MQYSKLTIAIVLRYICHRLGAITKHVNEYIAKIVAAIAKPCKILIGIPMRSSNVGRTMPKSIAETTAPIPSIKNRVLIFFISPFDYLIDIPANMLKSVIARIENAEEYIGLYLD